MSSGSDQLQGWVNHGRQLDGSGGVRYQSTLNWDIVVYFFHTEPYTTDRTFSVHLLLAFSPLVECFHFTDGQNDDDEEDRARRGRNRAPCQICCFHNRMTLKVKLQILRGGMMMIMANKLVALKKCTVKDMVGFLSQMIHKAITTFCSYANCTPFPLSFFVNGIVHVLVASFVSVTKCLARRNVREAEALIVGKP